MKPKNKEWKKLQGFRNHTERLSKDPNEPRRHRARCIYYHKDDKRCGFRTSGCPGSARCSMYKEYIVSKGDETICDTCIRKIEESQERYTLCTHYGKMRFNLSKCMYWVPM